MKLGTGLIIVAIGAILAFAVRGSPSWFSFQIAGWVIMLTGALGLILSRSDYRQWIRRVVIRRVPSSTVVQQNGEPPPPRALGSGRDSTRPEQRPPTETTPDRTIRGSAEPVEETTEYRRD